MCGRLVFRSVLGGSETPTRGLAWHGARGVTHLTPRRGAPPPARPRGLDRLGRGSRAALRSQLRSFATADRRAPHAPRAGRRGSAVVLESARTRSSAAGDAVNPASVWSIGAVYLNGRRGGGGGTRRPRSKSAHARGRTNLPSLSAPRASSRPRGAAPGSDAPPSAHACRHTLGVPRRIWCGTPGAAAPCCPQCSQPKPPWSVPAGRVAVLVDARLRVRERVRLKTQRPRPDLYRWPIVGPVGRPRQ
jgi:hypothetical protein